MKAGKAWWTVPLILLFTVLMQGSSIINSYTLVWWQAEYVPTLILQVYRLLIRIQYFPPQQFILPTHLCYAGRVSIYIHAPDVGSILLFSSSAR